MRLRETWPGNPPRRAWTDPSALSETAGAASGFAGAGAPALPPVAAYQPGRRVAASGDDTLDAGFIGVLRWLARASLKPSKTHRMQEPEEGFDMAILPPRETGLSFVVFILQDMGIIDWERHTREIT